MSGGVKAPDRIRVAQDADGFWSCREAVSGSQEYLRADVAGDLLEALRELNEALDDGLCNSGTPGFDSGRLGRAQEAAKTVISKAETAAPFECEDCIGMKEHGCYCAAMGATAPCGGAF